MIKKLGKPVVLFSLICVLCTPVNVLADNTEISPVSENVEITPRGDKFEWKYKIFDGKVYKRLFNIKSGKYVGDWILMGNQ